MAVYKCKMCGGMIEFNQGDTVGVCDSCGTKQTLPKTDDDVVANLFARANALRLKCEFDKAEEIYNKILEQDNSEAEAHWGIILCRYGIEYVDDPATGKKVPTCHRTSYEAITADAEFKAAIEFADPSQRILYEDEAKCIDNLQKDILSIVKNEKPFDVFICYKETDENGKRTEDSAIANDIYHQLTQEGFKVFYAAITLEDKLGQEYEPYIFAALNSSKVMLVVGTNPEYFNAVWVKNEWSRFLKLMKANKNKLLIPCYKNMDAYELPEEFAHLQAQDMGKIGFINDIVRGIKKVASAEPAATPVASDAGPAAVSNSSALADRGFLALEDEEWEKADEFFEQVLNSDARNAEAYLGKLMAELRVCKKEDLKDCEDPFDGSNNYQKACRFDSSLAEKLKNDIAYINERNENARLTGIYNSAKNAMNAANTEEAYKKAAEKFKSISGFKDADALAEQCLEKAEICKQERLAKEEADRIEAERKAEERRIAAEKAAKKRKKAFAIGTPIVAVCIAFVIVLTTVIIPTANRNKAYDIYGDVLNTAKGGDTITFGKYEQDNDTSNGKEDIEWIVLAKENEKALLISKYALDRQKYNSTKTDITWENCSLRKWMNGTFLNNAFSAEEQSQIQNTNVSADKNPKYSTNPGNATTDKVFLLSITEAEKYFTTDESRRCAPTAFAKAQGAYTSDIYKTASGEATCWWWLRSPGYYRYDAAYVDDDGSVFFGGDTVGYGSGAVRPALWINLKS